MKKIKIGSQKQCSVFQDRISSFLFVICLYNPNQVPNFETALFTARHNHILENSEAIDNINANSLPDNAILPLMVSDGVVLFTE